MEGRTLGEKHYSASGELTKSLRYVYDENGSVCGYMLNTDGTTWKQYYFVTNLQGDVIQVYSLIGRELVASYSYDSWGNIISATGEQAEENPFRYRGYYYDSESGFYYLSSRYYDSEIGRFINADSLIDNRSVITQNLFQYCGNNPVNNTDSSGHLFIGAIVGGVVGGIMGGLSALVSGTSVAVGIVTGAASGAAIGAVCDAVATGGISLVAGALICGAISGVANWTNQVANNYISNKSKESTTSNKSTSGNLTNGEQVSIAENINQIVGNISISIEMVDYKSVVSSAILSTVFAPISYGSNNLVGAAFNGCGSSALNLTGEIIASTFMEVNCSMVQLIIEIFLE